MRRLIETTDTRPFGTLEGRGGCQVARLWDLWLFLVSWIPEDSGRLWSRLIIGTAAILVGQDFALIKGRRWVTGNETYQRCILPGLIGWPGLCIDQRSPMGYWQ